MNIYSRLFTLMAISSMLNDGIHNKIHSDRDYLNNYKIKKQKLKLNKRQRKKLRL